MRRNDWLVLLLLSFVWGAAFPLTGHLLQALPPLWVATLRISIAGLGLGVFVLLRGGDWRPALRAWPVLLAMGFFNNAVPFTLLSWGQSRVDSGLAAIINASTPLWSAAIGAALAAAGAAAAVERSCPRRWIGVGLGFAGVAALVGPSAWFGGSDVWGQIACLGGALSYGLSGVVGRRLAGVPVLHAAAGQLICSTLIMTAIAACVAPPIVAPITASLVGAILALALGSTAFAYALYFRLLARVGATNTLMVTYLMPVVAVALSIPLLGQRPTWPMTIAFAMILGGVALAGRTRKATKPPQRRQAV